MKAAKPNADRAPHHDEPAGDYYEDWQRYFDLYNFAPVAYVRHDRVGAIVEINEAGCKLLGTSQAVLIGRPMIVFVLRESRLDFLEHMRRCRSHAGPSVVEMLSPMTRLRTAGCVCFT